MFFLKKKNEINSVGEYVVMGCKLTKKTVVSSAMSWGYPPQTSVVTRLVWELRFVVLETTIDAKLLKM